MNSGDLAKHEYYTTDGKDIWFRESYYDGPSCTLKNLRTGQQENFGLNGQTAHRFCPVTMPVGLPDNPILNDIPMMASNGPLRHSGVFPKEGL